MTPVPGHSYRLVFKCRRPSSTTGQMYDLDDLTAPLAAIQAADPNSTFTSGLCGFISSSRTATGASDVTIDNYYAAATDPNLAAPPALMDSIPGTPMVETRVPAARWQNFYNPASGISFVPRPIPPMSSIPRPPS